MRCEMITKSEREDKKADRPRCHVVRMRCPSSPIISHSFSWVVCVCVCVFLFPVAASKDTKPNMETSCARVGVVYPETDNRPLSEGEERARTRGTWQNTRGTSVDRFWSRGQSTPRTQKVLGSMLSREQARAPTASRERERENIEIAKRSKRIINKRWQQENQGEANTKDEKRAKTKTGT
jgi:hypothetical protein